MNGTKRPWRVVNKNGKTVCTRAQRHRALRDLRGPGLIGGHIESSEDGMTHFWNRDGRIEDATGYEVDSMGRRL